jgi:hypothetical protein
MKEQAAAYKAVFIARKAAKTAARASYKKNMDAFNAFQPRPAQAPASRSTFVEESSDGDFYSGEDYIRDCAEEWGMSEEQVENQLGFERD